MKKYILILLSITFFFNIFAHDSIFLEGYYIQRFKKNEIDFRLKNEELRKQGKSYYQMIDYTVDLYYFSIKANNINLIDSSSIKSIIRAENNYKNIEIYKFPPFGGLQYKYNLPEIDYDNLNSFDNPNYYYLDEDTIHLYKIYFISGKAIRLTVENDYLNTKRNIELAIHWNITSTDINKNVPYIYIYMFYDFYIHINRIPVGFQKWLLD